MHKNITSYFTNSPVKIGDFYHGAEHGARTPARSLITGAKSPVIFDGAPVIFAIAQVLVGRSRGARTLIITPAHCFITGPNVTPKVPKCVEVKIWCVRVHNYKVRAPCLSRHSVLRSGAMGGCTCA